LLDNQVSVSGTAIQVYSSGGMLVEGNWLHNNNRAFYTGIGSFSGSFKGNQVTNNTTGIVLPRSGFIEVLDNDFVDNATGIQASTWASTSGQVYHNNFIDNAVHVSYFQEDMTWHDGYLSGGNFWSGWTEPDAFGGAEQSVPGADGIVDLPYYGDEYPFVVSSGWVPSNTAPVAVADCCIEVYPAEDVTLDASASYDEEGPIVRYTWYFEDRTAITDAPDTSDDGLFDGMTVVSYDQGGMKHDVTLEVADEHGLTDQAAIVVTVLSFHEGLATIRNDVESVALDAGPQNAILAKLRAAEAALNSDADVLSAIENLQDLISQLSAPGFCKQQTPDGFCDVMRPKIERLQNSLLATL
jgi:hypothetical protein